MTDEQIAQFNMMRDALSTIAKFYKTPSQLRRSYSKDSDQDYLRALEMSHDRIQTIAWDAVSGFKAIGIETDGE